MFIVVQLIQKFNDANLDVTKTQYLAESNMQRLNEFAGVIKGATITNFDYEELIEREGENIFIFLDPPYYSATKPALYGKNGHLHKSFDHEKFAAAMKNCQPKWLITYDDGDYVRDLFSFARIIFIRLEI